MSEPPQVDQAPDRSRLRLRRSAAIFNRWRKRARRPRRLVGNALVRVAARVDPSVLPAAFARLDPVVVRAAAAALPAPGPPVGRPPDGGCVVCHSPRVSRREVQYVGNPGLRKTVNKCARCGFVGIDEIRPSHYRTVTSLDQLPQPKRRMGTVERPGREFQMARMALEILDRKRDQNVLVYGAGRSLDNLHIQRLPGVGTVSIADIMQVRDDAPFVDVNDPGKQRFPVVVASEVIEHFRDPWSDFATMLGLVTRQGLLVCGTNIHGGRPKLERDRYIYYPDHTSYYSGSRSVGSRPRWASTWTSGFRTGWDGASAMCCSPDRRRSSVGSPPTSGGCPWPRATRPSPDSRSARPRRGTDRSRPPTSARRYGTLLRHHLQTRGDASVQVELGHSDPTRRQAASI
jgi:hypothetical protein